MHPLDRRVLYVSYDGVLEPLGESQVVAYLERLSPLADVTLLSFEKSSDLVVRERVDRMRARLTAAGVRWIPRRYHKRPPVLSTACDVVSGCLAMRWWARGHRGAAHIVHARGYVPALVASYAKRVVGARFLFDMRGFWVDEKVEAGQWPPGGLLYRVGKWFERRFFAEADAIVSLTAAGVREFPKLGVVGPRVPVVVIPTCADLERFAPGPADANLRHTLGLDGAFVVGYAGTLSNWYLRGETLAYLAWLSRRFDRMKALVVTREEHGRLRADAERVGLPADRLVLARASFDEMPALMRLMDLGVFFIRACFSKRASAATKLAELLGSGVPVVINDGIGDSGEIVRTGDVGVVLGELTPASFDQSESGLRQLLADSTVAARCRRVAQQEFDLTQGVARYGALYDRLFGARGATPSLDTVT